MANRFVYDDVTQTLEMPQVYLMSRELKRKYAMTVEDLQLYVGTTDNDEISFTITKELDGEVVPYWDELKDLSIVYVEQFGAFEMTVDVQDGDVITKTASGISLESELSQVYVDFSVNGDTDRENTNNWDNSGNYIPTVLYNKNDTAHSLLHRLLKDKAPHWSIGHVDEQITTNDGLNDTKMYVYQVVRTFEFKSDIYSCLQEIAEELDLCYEFDTLHRIINVYDLNERGDTTTIYIDGDNLQENATISSNKDSIKNCFKIEGGDDNITSAIRAVNPNGSQYIYYFSDDQKSLMSAKLVKALNDYDKLYNDNQEAYQNAVTDWFDAMDNVTSLQTTMSPTIKNVDTTAQKELAKLTSTNIGTIPVTKSASGSLFGIKKAVLQVVRLMVDYRYDVTVNSNDTYYSYRNQWEGSFTVKNTTDSEDMAVGVTITLDYSVGEKDFVINKIENLVKDAKLYRVYATADKPHVMVDKQLLQEWISQYNMDTLKQYNDAYKACLDTLVDMGWGNRGHQFYDIYKVYYDVVTSIIQPTMIYRSNQINSAMIVEETARQKVENYHTLLNFADFLDNYGSGVSFKQFCTYIREETYSNTNYISDGMNNEDMIKNAKKLLEVATRELYKASTFQQTYKLNILNFYEDSNYSSIFDDFDVYNWIRTEVDEKVVQLRIIGIRINYNDLTSLEVEFSDKIKNMNGFDDVQSILSKSKSMATSYSYVAKQANKSTNLENKIRTMRTKGLASAFGNISNSENQEINITDKCIELKGVTDDGTYDPHQMKITGKNLVMTDDAWETTKLAIGLMDIDSVDDNGKNVTEQVYGVVADRIIGNLILSEKMKIGNESGTVQIDGNGITLDTGSIKWKNGDTISDSSNIVTTIVTEYYISTSDTELKDGSWDITPPKSVESGKYVWSRQKFVYIDGTSLYKNTSCLSNISGRDGKDGKDGTNGTNGTNGKDGVSVKSVVAEYYLSTSKTTQSGGSWSTTNPTWGSGKYVWIRNKITYSDGKTETTTPLCDSSWEAVNDIKIGGRNLLAETAKPDVTGSNYAGSYVTGKMYTTIGEKPFSDFGIVAGVTKITITFDWSFVGKETGTFMVELRQYGGYKGSTKLTTLSDTNKSGKFEWTGILDSDTVTSNMIYMRMDNSVGVLTVSNCKLEIGNKATDWSPAPEDISNKLDKFNTALTGSATTEIGSDYVISPKIGGGYLEIAKGNNYVKIDPSGLSSNVIFEAHGSNGHIKLDNSGNAEFSGKITATSGKIAGFNINSYSLYNTNESTDPKNPVNDTTESIKLDAVNKFLVLQRAPYRTECRPWGFDMYGKYMQTSTTYSSELASSLYVRTDETSTYLSTELFIGAHARLFTISTRENVVSGTAWYPFTVKKEGFSCYAGDSEAILRNQVVTMGGLYSDKMYTPKITVGDNALKTTYFSVDNTSASLSVPFNTSINFSNKTTSKPQDMLGIYGTVGDNDYWYVKGGATAANAGHLEIATGDDGTEPIYVRQYGGGSTPSLKRSLTLLGSGGETRLAGSLYLSSAGGFYGKDGNLFISSSSTLTTKYTHALDAVEKNPSVSGTLANEISHSLTRSGCGVKWMGSSAKSVANGGAIVTVTGLKGTYLFFFSVISSDGMPAWIGMNNTYIVDTKDPHYGVVSHSSTICKAATITSTSQVIGLWNCTGATRTYNYGTHITWIRIND